jgi:hypothetical protein
VTGLFPVCSQTFLAYLDKKNQECGYAGYLDQHLKYPPSGPLPLPGGSPQITENCDLWFEIYDAAVIINPAFNIYRIFDVVCLSWSDSLLDPLIVLPSTQFPGMSLAIRKILTVIVLATLMT